MTLPDNIAQCQSQSTATEIDPNLGAPAQRIHWMANTDRSRKYDNDKEFLTSFTVFLSALRHVPGGSVKIAIDFNGLQKITILDLTTQQIWIAVDDDKGCLMQSSHTAFYW